MGHEGISTLPPERGGELIDEKEEFGIKAKVVLDTSRVEEKVPEGKKDETRSGFAFYELGENGLLNEEPFIVDMCDKPELIVVKEEDYRNLQDKKFIAKPVRFIWSTDRKKWSVEF